MRWIVESGRKTNRILNKSLVWTNAGAQKRRTYEALPQTPPGGEPPETPGPLSLDFDFTDRVKVVKGTQAAPKAGAPLTTSTRSEGGETNKRKRGPEVTGARTIVRLPLVGPEEWLKT